MSPFQYLHAVFYDRLTCPLEPSLAPYRHRIAGRTAGDVLEIGGGTGANLRYYPWDVRLTVVEPNPEMARRLRAKAARLERTVKIVVQDGERLPFPDSSFDAVVTSLVMCSVDSPEQVLAGVQRVLRPGGTFHFYEHVAAEEAGLRRWQSRLNVVWTPLTGGCRLDRPTESLIRAAGFSRVSVETFDLPGAPKVTRRQIVGSATV